MLSLLWGGDKRFAIKPRYQILFFEEERTCALPSGISFELLMRVFVSW